MHHRLEAYVGLGIQCVRQKKKSSAVFNQLSSSNQTGCQRLPAGSSELWYCICLPLRRQQRFTLLLFFHAVGNSNLSTTNYSTVELGSTGKLTQYFLQGKGVIFHMVHREQAVVRPTAIIPPPSPTLASNNWSHARVLGDNPPWPSTRYE